MFSGMGVGGDTGRSVRGSCLGDLGRPLLPAQARCPRSGQASAPGSPVTWEGLTPFPSLTSTLCYIWVSLLYPGHRYVCTVPTLCQTLALAHRTSYSLGGRAVYVKNTCLLSLQPSSLCHLHCPGLRRPLLPHPLWTSTVPFSTWPPGGPPPMP